MHQKPIRMEELDKVLTHPNITNVQSAQFEDTATFQRQRNFTVSGTDYSIVWFRNVSTLYIGPVEVPFVTVHQSGTWPNMKKLNLQFLDASGEVCCVLPIEDYPQEAQ